VVVGVVEDPPAEESRAGEAHRVFLPPDADRLTTAVLVRTVGPAAPLLPEVRRIALDEVPGTIPSLTTVAADEDARHREFRLASGGVSAAGAVALLLAALGLYAVVAFSVGQRKREIAVRMAVGASGRQIVRRYVADGLRLGAIGMAIGLPISVIGLRLLMIDPDVPRVPLSGVTSIAVLGVLAVTAAAAWIPSRRAASVDVAGTLRRE
jgi:cell division protein FtsX